MDWRELLQKWMPNRKVLSGAIAGVLSWVALRYFGVELDAEVQNAIVLLLVTGISYLVPLPQATDAQAK